MGSTLLVRSLDDVRRSPCKGSHLQQGVANWVGMLHLEVHQESQTVASRVVLARAIGQVLQQDLDLVEVEDEEPEEEVHQILVDVRQVCS